MASLSSPHDGHLSNFVALRTPRLIALWYLFMVRTQTHMFNGELRLFSKFSIVGNQPAAGRSLLQTVSVNDWERSGETSAIRNVALIRFLLPKNRRSGCQPARSDASHRTRPSASRGRFPARRIVGKPRGSSPNYRASTDVAGRVGTIHSNERRPFRFSPK